MNESTQDERAILRAVVEVLTSAVLLCDRKGVILTASRGAGRILSEGRKHLEGKRVTELFHKTSRHVDLDDLDSIADTWEGMGVIQIQETMENGHALAIQQPLMMRMRRIHDQDDWMLLIELQPQSTTASMKMHRWSEAVAAAKEQWESAFDAIQDMVLIVDQNVQVVRANRAVADNLGMPFSDLIGKSFHDLFLPKNDALQTQIEKAVQHRKTMVFEFRQHPSNVDVKLTCSPIRSTVAPVAEHTVLIMRHLDDQQAHASQLEVTEKLAAIGELATSVAHELNNPLTSVLGYSQLLKVEQRPEERRRIEEVIIAEAERSRKIVMNLLDLTRWQPTEHEAVDMNRIITDLLAVQRHHISSEDVEIELNLDDHLPTVSGDANQLRQVLLNLFNNGLYAVKQVASPRRVTIITRQRGDSLELCIEDTGPGIESRDIPRIFDPFFTTKPSGKGTGLGLSVVYTIVAAHGGTVTAENKLPRGSRFRILLPADGDSDEEREKRTSPPRILVVEDEPSILELIKALMEGMGYEVILANSGPVAYGMVEHHGPFDLIMSDVTVPGLDVYELFTRAQDHGDVSFIIVTGDPTAPILPSIRNDFGAKIVTKPFDLTSLQHLVEQEFQRRSSKEQ